MRPALSDSPIIEPSRPGEDALFERLQNPAAAPDGRAVKVGLAAGLGAHFVWGFIPIYYKQLAHVPPFTILAYRIVATAVVMSAVVLLTGNGPALRAVLRSKKTLLTLVASGALVAANWVLFITAVTGGHVLESSLGYFITPLFIVALGVGVLKERLRPMQTAALGLAAAGVGVLIVAGGVVPWLSLGMAGTFGLYSLLRKLVPTGAVVALATEVLLLAPVGLLGIVLFGMYGGPWVMADGAPPGHGLTATALLLCGCGLLTAAPLLMFGVAAKRLRLATLGFIQYFGPTMQFAIAVAVYHEPFGRVNAVSFGMVWLALAMFSADAALQERQRRAT